MKETDAKYLAGLSDADASLSFSFVGNILYLEYQLCASEAVDKDGCFIKSLPELTGVGYVSSSMGMSNMHNYFRLANYHDLEKFLPHITKHMVIKGEHWAWMLEMRRKFKGQKLTSEQITYLKDASKQSRAKAGPLKHKKHPTWGWVAGYLDGDGNYKFRDAKNKRGCHYKDMSVNCIAHENDRVGIDLLHKAFGGRVYQVKNKPLVKWYRNLGPRDKDFALHFLSKMAGRSHLKKWKVEQMISHHRQRLNPTSSKEQVIV